jgi:peptidoglycan/xylan/chitin deacetylase (PgdA/CDA1 family)
MSGHAPGLSRGAVDGICHRASDTGAERLPPRRARPALPAAGAPRSCRGCAPSLPRVRPPRLPRATRHHPPVPAVLRHALPALAPIAPGVADRLHLARTLPSPGVALTFDDGPHPEGTPAILAILARHKLEATFFLVGEQVERRPALAAEIAAAGHAIGLHGYRHRCQLRMTKRDIAEDYRRGAATIADAVQRAPELHRPPYGIYSGAGLAVARDQDLRPLLWSKWGRDWRKFTTPERIAARVTGGIAGGDVILLHDADFYSSRESHRRTAKALPLVIAELKRRELGTVLPV